MENDISRYRNIAALVVVLGAQFLLLAYQVKGRQDVPVVRLWASSAFAPVARGVSALRENTIGVVEHYAGLASAQNDNVRLRSELDRLKLENQFLKNELRTASNAQALAMFLPTSPQRLLAARIIGASTTPGSRVLFLDRGARDGVRERMAVITPDGIAGRIGAVRPGGAQLILVTDLNFAAGVITERSRVQGVLKGQGHASVLVEYVQNEDKVAVGEMLFTSGDDVDFPKGLPVGEVKISRRGRGLFKEIFVEPAGLARGLDSVLIVLQGVPQELPAPSTATPESVKEAPLAVAAPGAPLPIDADKILQKYERISEANRHRMGAGPAPSFTLTAPAAPPPAPPAGAKP
ncbi:MAG: rod shape-determining protein MreC [Acidobacteria bacterium]|nr:rod shape-determining protein MreC [Acidobacteriota bacterium]